MRNLVLLFILLAGVLASTGSVHAQEPYTHQPQLRQILDASDFDTIRLPGYAQSRLPKSYVPTLRNGRAQSPQCPPDVYADAIALDGVPYTITPITRNGFPGFDGTSTADTLLDYGLDATLTYTDAQELFSGEPGDGVYTELRVAFALEDDTLAAHAAGLMQEPETPADLKSVHDNNKAGRLDEWIKSGKLTEIRLPASVPLRPQALIQNEAETLHFMCPWADNISSYNVKLVGAIWTLDNSFGITRSVIWVQVEHVPETIAACPLIRNFVWIEGPSFLHVIGPLAQDLEDETTAREIVWRQPIILQPIGGGQAIEGVASFLASPHGQTLIIYVMILTATAVIVVPAVYVLMLSS